LPPSQNGFVTNLSFQRHLVTFVLLIGRAFDRQLVLHLFVVDLKSDKYEERSLLETKQKLYQPLKFHEQEREREREREKRHL